MNTKMSIHLLRHSQRLLRLTVLATCLGMLAASAASAATFVVHKTGELETAVTSANLDGEANIIELTAGATAETYQPSKTLIFTNTSGTQTLTGPAGKIGEDTPSVTLSGNDVKDTEESEKELITVKAGVTVALKHILVTSGGEAAVNSGIVDEEGGTLNVEDATISGNSGSQIYVQSDATASLTNSTLSNGHEFGLIDEGTANLLNVTVVHNGESGIGAGAGTLNLTNTIVALNGGSQCGSLGGGITNDHSLASDASCGGTAALQNKSPLLTTLGNDGGSTTLYSEKVGSPTIDAGDAAKCPATDQRGYPRPYTGGPAGCDIGSDEYSPTPPTIKVPSEIVTSATSPSGAEVTYNVEATDPGSLVKKLECAPESGSTFKDGTTKVECTAVDGHENTAKASFNVTVNAASCAANPAIATQPSGVTVTEPASAGFKVTEGTVPANCAAATIQWELSTNGGTSFAPIAGATSATYTVNSTHASESGDELRAVLTNAHGKTTSSAATLTVNAVVATCAASPAIEAQPSSVTVTEPASAGFKVTEGTVPANCAAATIQWELSTNGGTSFAPIAGATSATYTIDPTHASESGDELRAVFTNAHGKTTSSAATLTVNAVVATCAASPAIETQPSNVTVTEPASAGFKVTEGTVPADCAAATIQWEVSTNDGTTFTPIAGATNAAYTINSTHASESGDELRAVLTNAHGKTTSSAATLTVNAVVATCAGNPTISTQPSSVAVTEPASASFKVSEGAIPANCAAGTVQWEVSTNGGSTFTPVTGATNATYAINSTHASESGDELRAVLTNAHGKTTSSAATLTVNAVVATCGASPVIGMQPSNVTVTEPASASFKVSEGAIPANCAAGTIQWELSTNGGTSFTPIAGATSATYTVNPTHTSESGDELRAVLTNAHGKTTSANATLAVSAVATSPEAAIRQLLKEVDSSNIAHGLRKTLACLLSEALNGLGHTDGYGHLKCDAAFPSRATKSNRQKDTRPDACEALEEFVDVIRSSQHGTKSRIPAKLATTWTRTAEGIEASLGCTRSGGGSSPHHSKGSAHGHGHGRRSVRR